ncbi:MAG: HAD family hydrolase [Elusimicrobia bacterium]|nr:HAD family hydrolase [Candidatus Liberimonas magnetica]
MENKKAIFFDIYNTLIKIKTDENDFKTYEFLSNWLAYKGVKITPRGLLSQYRKIINEELRSSKEPYPDVEIKDVFERITKKKDILKELTLLFRVLTTKSLIILPNAKQVLDSLHRKVRLAVVSNSQRSFTMPELARFDIAKYFEYILFSSDIKARKPTPKIFLKALGRMKVKPADAVFVGDDLFEDVAGAKRAGMKAVWIKHKEIQNLPAENKWPLPDAEVKIDNYSSLPEVICNLIDNP